MDFGRRMMTKAWARVRAFVAPRRSRVVNSGEEEGLRNPSFSRRRRIAGSAGATRALRPRHDENDPVFDKIRQIHGLIPQIHAFFRQIQDPSERGKNTKSLKIKRLWESRDARRGYFARPRHLRASARIRAPSPRRHPAGGGSGTARPASTETARGAFMRPVRGPGDDAARIVGITPCGCPSRISPVAVVRERPAPPTKRTIAGLSAHAAATGGRGGRPYEITPPRSRPSFAAKAGIRGFDSWRNPIGGRSSDGRFTNRPYEGATPASPPVDENRHPRRLPFSSCVPTSLAYNSSLIYRGFCR